MQRTARDIIGSVTGYWSALIGFFLGFAFGVGCALAVMYSIFMGGYRAAVKDSVLPSPPDRLLAARAKLSPSATSKQDENRAPD